MKISRIENNREIKLLNVSISNKKYSLKWMASSYYSNVIVCLVSPDISYNAMQKVIEKYDGNSEFQDGDEYFIKITNQTAAEIPVECLMPPVNITLFPVQDDIVYFPEDEEAFDRNKKTIRGTIKYTIEECKARFGFGKTKDISIEFSNNNFNIDEETVFADYEIEGKHYPVTGAMIGKNLRIKIPMKESCQISLTEDFSKKYSLIKE